MTEKKFIEKCCTIFETEQGELDRDSSPDDVEAWDSRDTWSFLP